MGLLDLLGGGASGNSGSLLAFLQSLQGAQGQAQNPQPGGLISDQAQYGAGPQMAPAASLAPVFAPQPAITPVNSPGPLDNARWPAGPVGAPSQANAQAIPQQPPAIIPAQPQGALPQMPPAGPGPLQSFFDRAASGLQSMSRGGSMTGAIRGQYDDPTSQAANVANVTARAFIARGIDPRIAIAAVQPGNSEALKELFKQVASQGTHAQEIDKDGNVWDVNRQTGQRSIALAAKDDRFQNVSDGAGGLRSFNSKTGEYGPPIAGGSKAPAGFATDDKGMHFIPGGPADPAYLRLAEAQKKDPNGNYVLGRGGEIVKNNPDGTVTVMHKNEAEPPVPMDPAALEILARREIGGDFSGRKNLGRGAQGAADLKAITNKSAEILTKEMNMTPTEAAAHLLKQQQQFAAQGQGLNSEARTTGVREANLNLILKAADAAIPAALAASDKVERTGWVPLNRIIQGGEVVASDPDLKKFGMANLQLAEHWARAMNPTGVMRESDRDKALEFLSTKDSKETYKAAVGQLRTQIERERDAVRSTRGMASMPGVAPETTAPPEPLQPGQSANIGGVSIKRVN